MAAARQMSADVLVVDSMMRSAFEAAAELGMPAVALVHTSYEAFAYQWGSAFMGCDAVELLARCRVALALQPRGFDRPCPMPPGHVYVGAIGHPDLDRKLEPGLRALLEQTGDPWVLLSFSSTVMDGQVENLQTVLNELAALPVRVLLTRAGAGDAQLRLPANAMARDFIPHDLVLPWMSAVVSHGGMSTVATALGAGVPMVCVPLGRDQAGNADGVARIGAGLAATARGAGEALTQVLGDRRFTAAARQIADAMEPLGGGAVAADLAEGVLAPTYSGGPPGIDQLLP